MFRSHITLNRSDTIRTHTRFQIHAHTLAWMNLLKPSRASVHRDLTRCLIYTSSCQTLAPKRNALASQIDRVPQSGSVKSTDICDVLSISPRRAHTHTPMISSKLLFVQLDGGGPPLRPSSTAPENKHMFNVWILCGTPHDRRSNVGGRRVPSAASPSLDGSHRCVDSEKVVL